MRRPFVVALVMFGWGMCAVAAAASAQLKLGSIEGQVLISPGRTFKIAAAVVLR